MPAPTAADARPLWQRFPPDQFPRLVAPAPLRERTDLDAEFAFGLDLIVTGLQARRPRGAP